MSWKALESFGKFKRTLRPGIRWYFPVAQKVILVNNQVSNIDKKSTFKTKDNVFVDVRYSVQYTVKPEDSAKSIYSMTDPRNQIVSYTDNLLRSYVSSLNLDSLYDSSNELEAQMREKINKILQEHGYTVLDLLLKSISPESNVMEAMNKINASQRLLEASRNEAEAKYITEVKQAEADKDRKRLQGEGISLQRQAIMDGYKKSILDTALSLGISTIDVTSLVLKTQYMDTLENIGKSAGTKVLYVDKSVDLESRNVFNGIESAQYLVSN